MTVLPCRPRCSPRTATSCFGWTSNRSSEGIRSGSSLSSGDGKPASNSEARPAGTVPGCSRRNPSSVSRKRSRSVLGFSISGSSLFQAAAALASEEGPSAASALAANHNHIPPSATSTWRITICRQGEVMEHRCDARENLPQSKNDCNGRNSGPKRYCQPGNRNRLISQFPWTSRGLWYTVFR